MCAAYRLLHSRPTLFKGKVKSGMFGGFYCFFKWAFYKKNCFFLVGLITLALKIIMDV